MFIMSATARRECPLARIDKVQNCPFLDRKFPKETV
jgi:hypothetical protein